MDKNNGLQTALQIQRIAAQKKNYFRWISKLFKSMNLKGFHIRPQILYKALISHCKASTIQ